MVPDPETPQIEPSTTAAQETPMTFADRMKALAWTPEQSKRHGELIVQALKTGLSKNTETNTEVQGPPSPPIDPPTEAAQETPAAPPKLRTSPWTDEEYRAHQDKIVQALKRGLREDGVK